MRALACEGAGTPGTAWRCSRASLGWSALATQPRGTADLGTLALQSLEVGRVGCSRLCRTAGRDGGGTQPLLKTRLRRTASSGHLCRGPQIPRSWAQREGTPLRLVTAKAQEQDEQRGMQRCGDTLRQPRGSCPHGLSWVGPRPLALSVTAPPVGGGPGPGPPDAQGPVSGRGLVADRSVLPA